MQKTSRPSTTTNPHVLLQVVMAAREQCDNVSTTKESHCSLSQNNF